MILLISGSVLPTGVFFIRSSVGSSVARAAPKDSMIKFTHKSWTALRGMIPEETAATKLITRVAIFTVSWN